MAEKKFVCDCCEEEWEESFFCPVCSGWYREEHEVPNLMWDGYPASEETEMEMEDVHKDICFNCCNDHPRSPTKDALDDGDSAASRGIVQASALSGSEALSQPTPSPVIQTVRKQT